MAYVVKVEPSRPAYIVIGTSLHDRLYVHTPAQARELAQKLLEAAAEIEAAR